MPGQASINNEISVSKLIQKELLKVTEEKSYLMWVILNGDKNWTTNPTNNFDITAKFAIYER